MLRLLVLLLLLANAAYYSWAQGLFAGWGAGPTQQSEPHRLEQQIRPDAIRLLSPDEVRRIEAPVVGTSARPADCLQAGLFDEGQAQSLRAALESWPSGTWKFEPGAEGARWMVYMGKYPAPDLLERKKAELRQLGVSFDPAIASALQPGLSLGVFSSEAAARHQLDFLAGKGVRTARVVQERPEQVGSWLKFTAVDETLRPRLEEIRSSLGDRALRPCR
jgi:hypothetical protein